MDISGQTGLCKGIPRESCTERAQTCLGRTTEARTPPRLSIPIGGPALPYALWPLRPHGHGMFMMPTGGRCMVRGLLVMTGLMVGLDHGIGHVMLFEVDSEVRAPAPPMPILLRISSAASDRKSAPLPSSRQAGGGKSC